MKVGIIGCGSIAKNRHAPEYTANPHVKEIVFYDRNPERAQALANQFNGSVAKTVEELFANDEVMAISDCSSNESHHIFSTMALQNGKHVLTEKPISLTVENAKKVIQAQKESGKKLMIGHNQRFSRAHEKAKEIIQSNTLGKVLTFQTTFGHKGPEYWGVNKSNSTWFFQKERSGIGVVGDLGIHKIDLIHFLFDDEVDQVAAFQGALDKVDEHRQPIGVCDNLVATLKTKKGVLGTAAFSWTYYGDEDNSTKIYCEKGMLKIYDSPNFQVEVVRDNGERENYELEEIQTNDNQTSSGVIDAFINSIRLDQTPPVTGEDALSSLKVVLAMLEASENEEMVTIK